MAHTDLASYFKINFALMQHHKYSLTEIENMIPWEKDVYVALLEQYIEEENLKQQQQSGSLLPKLNPEFSGVNPKTGEYLSPEERKQVFKLRKRKLDPSKVFDKSAIVKVDKPQANMDSCNEVDCKYSGNITKITNYYNY